MINMVEENTVEENTVEENTDEVEETPVEAFDVNYACLRCATVVSNTELSRLPEIKCICGFRVFTKVRPPVVKTIKAV
jgi:DNA-directed RNA polymerase subunit P